MPCCSTGIPMHGAVSGGWCRG